YLDGRSNYFEMNPSGRMADAIRGMGSNNRQWDGIWNARVRYSEVGWTLEIEIPFRTLNLCTLRTGWTIGFSIASRRSIDGLRRSFSTPSGSETDAKHNGPTRRIPIRAVFPEVYA